MCRRRRRGSIPLIVTIILLAVTRRPEMSGIRTTTLLHVGLFPLLGIIVIILLFRHLHAVTSMIIGCVVLRYHLLVMILGLVTTHLRKGLATRAATLLLLLLATMSVMIGDRLR